MDGFKLREAVRSSLWAVPGAFVLGALALALLLALLERPLGGVSWLRFPGEADTARSILSTIAGVMITFTGLVFSITVLVLQLASQQYTPRVLRTFMQDRISKVALGLFVATFVYSVAVLWRVGPGELPALSIGVAIAFVLASIGVFVQYISHVTNAIQVSSIINRVAEEARGAIDDVFRDESDRGDDERVASAELGRASEVIDAPRPGMIQHVNVDRLVRVAAEADVVLVVRSAIGDFVAKGAALVTAHGGELDDDARERVLGSVSIGRQRTGAADVAFSLRSLVDIAQRALSPSLNDPTTAVQAIDHVHDLLRRIVARPWPSANRRDEDGNVRLVLPEASWDDYVTLAVTEIRRSGRDSIQVLRRLRAMLEDLRDVAPLGRRAPMERELRLIDANAADVDPSWDAGLARRADMQGIGGP